MRIFLGLLAGIFAAVLTVFVLEGIGHMIFPPPDGVDLKDPETIRTLMSDIPLGAKIAVLVAWFVGTIAGGLTAVRVAHAGAWPAWAISGIMGLFIAINLFWIPHPVWMIIGALALTVLGGWIASRSAP